MKLQKTLVFPSQRQFHELGVVIMFSYRFARLSRKANVSAIKARKTMLPDLKEARMLPLVFLAALFPVLGLSVVAQQATDKAVAATTGRPDATGTATGDLRYRIGAGDVLDIRIYNRPNLSRDAVRVEGSGMIRMPLIETEIQAACQTEGELAHEIATRYAKYYKNLQVDVFIKEYHSIQVAIIGSVNEQSRFELQRNVRLLELLTYAKGPSAKAGQSIHIVHSTAPSPCKQAEGSEDVAASFSTYKLSDTLQGDPKANPFLEAGDIVTLPEADQVYVVGNVFTPMTIALKEPITLTRAIAMAGGLKQDSKKEKVRVVRQEAGSMTKKEIIVDLSAIEKKRADDVALLPNDIVDVPTSGGKSFLRSLIGGVAPSVSQLPIRIIP
jgi:polysaccharide export outer membrane protein